MVETDTHNYEFCRRCVANALDLLYCLRDNRPPSMADIRQQRHLLSILRRQRFEQLKRQFLPPLDHQDMWQLYVACETIYHACASALSECHRQQVSVLSGESRHLLVCVIHAVEALQSALITFPVHKRSSAAADHTLLSERYVQQAQDAFCDLTQGNGGWSSLRLYDHIGAIAVTVSRVNALLYQLMLQ